MVLQGRRILRLLGENPAENACKTMKLKEDNAVQIHTACEAIIAWKTLTQ